jgi:GTP-binding protein
VMLSGRGTDRRLDQTSRASASDRLAARIDRRRHRTDEELLTGAAEDEE